MFRFKRKKRTQMMEHDNRHYPPGNFICPSPTTPWTDPHHPGPSHMWKMEPFSDSRYNATSPRHRAPNPRLAAQSLHTRDLRPTRSQRPWTHGKETRAMHSDWDNYRHGGTHDNARTTHTLSFSGDLLESPKSFMDDFLFEGRYCRWSEDEYIFKFYECLNGSAKFWFD